MTVYALEGQRPRISQDISYIASSAEVIGNVELSRGVSVWFGVVIRGDNELICIGENSNIQDHSVLHTDPGFPLTIGYGCTIGHRATLHGCTIGDNTLIGMGAIILNGAKIGKNCLVAAGALVTEGAVVPDNTLIMGAPAKRQIPMDDNAIEGIRLSATHYSENGRRFASGLTVVEMSAK
ncbi:MULTISPECIES: gamma carbonic anhydrase family protein [unclassified Thalassospira]|uniref:gamma carbonic anhydrase family protein n=1 Tax=unclassified Thalassospira TaxID=2648997 RepID=UPI0007A575FE|nr:MULTISPECIES: gamma carbonic anhydrase family protein [unclassified Thalassospira]KZC99942.1 gamma carbonic anhydrase family protein [Thalassospira sp. MCCC 1A02898]ONH85896.1 acetyltransferase [Thalassospira sp. MCCC 1A02803]